MNWNRFKSNSLPVSRRKIPAMSLAMLGRRRSASAVESEAGMSLLELVVACAILLILATASIPIARNTIKWKKEEQLRWDLRQMREAIDRYKDASDKGKIQVKAGTEGYPGSLDALVKPTPLTGTAADKGIRFLGGIRGD